MKYHRLHTTFFMRNNETQWTKVSGVSWWCSIWSRVPSPKWRRRRIEGQITPRRGWWACVLWRKFRSKYKRCVSISWWAVLIVGLVTMVTVMHSVSEAVKEGEFGSPFSVLWSLSLLFHSSVLEPSLHLCCGKSERKMLSRFPKTPTRASKF